MKNKILSMMLCAALIFTMLAMPQIQPPAHAEAVALTATVIAVAVTLIVAAGVTWTSVAMGKQCTTQFLTDKPEAKQIIEDIVAAMPQTGVLVLTKTMLPKVKQFMKMVGEYFKGKTGLAISTPTSLWAVGGVLFTNADIFSSYTSASQTDSKSVFAFAPYVFGQKVSVISYVGNTYEFSTSQSGGNGSSYSLTLTCNGKYVIGTGTWSIENFKLPQCFHYGFYCKTVNGVAYLIPFIAYYETPENGVLNYSFYALDTSYNKIPVDLTQAKQVSDTSTVPVDTIGLDNIDDINEAIAHSVGQAAEGVKVDIQKLIEEIEAAKEDALPWTVEGVRELIGIQDELKEIAREQERIKDAIKEGTKEDDMNVPQLPTTITEKFPFCVPFDLIALAKTFSAQPVAPKVTIPVVFESMHYSHDFVFDFSGDNWDKVAAVIRWGTLIFFILGLTLVTRKLIKG